MFAVVHHPAYVAPAEADTRYRWNKNGLVRDLLAESGSAFEWIEPEPMPRAWLERVHCADYVAEVLAAAVPKEKERRIGFRSRRSSPGGRRWCREARTARRWRRCGAAMRSTMPAGATTR